MSESEKFWLRIFFHIFCNFMPSLLFLLAHFEILLSFLMYFVGMSFWHAIILFLKNDNFHVTPWLIHVNVWQNPLQYCKIISLQLIKINEKKMITSSRIQLQSYFFGCVSHSVLSDSLHPMDCNPSGSSVCAILQVSILEWVAIVSSWGSSRPRDWTLVSCIAGECFTVWAAREALFCLLLSCKMRFLLLLGKEELELFPPNFRSLFLVFFSTEWYKI